MIISQWESAKNLAWFFVWLVMKSSQQEWLWSMGSSWQIGWFCCMRRIQLRGWVCLPNLFICHEECYSNSSSQPLRMRQIRLNDLPWLIPSRMCHLQIGKHFRFLSNWEVRLDYRLTMVKLFWHFHETILSGVYNRWVQHAPQCLYFQIHLWVQWARRWRFLVSEWPGGWGGWRGDISFLYLLFNVPIKDHKQIPLGGGDGNKLKIHRGVVVSSKLSI